METSEVETDSPLFVSSRIIPQAVLDDLCSRFLINIPEEERKDVVRLCFQIETAHWFYLDFYRQEQPDLPACGLKDFTNIIFQQFPFLNKTGEHIDTIFENWKKYKYSVPVFGAIILNQTLDKCVLVQPFMSRTSWGFPKGKLNKDESAFDCAVREVMEETGFNISDYADPELFLEHTFHDHQIRLYIVPGVPEKTSFHPQTRGEIKGIEWFFIDYLPSHKKDTVSRENLGLNPNAFFMVMPFVRGLRKWIAGAQQKEPNPTAQEMSTVQAPGNIHLQKLLAKEEQRLEQEQKRAALERRRKQQQEKFQLQHELNHPLRHHHGQHAQRANTLRGYQTSREDGSRLGGSPAVKERDEQLVYKILQRPVKESQLAEDTRHPIEKLLSGIMGVASPDGMVHRPDPHPQREHSSPPLSVPQEPSPSRRRTVPPSEHSWEDSEFQFSSAAFLNFKFDRKSVLACLPT